MSWSYFNKFWISFFWDNILFDFAESSILKIKGTEIQQGLTEIYVEAAGEYALMYPGAGGYGSNDKPSGPEHAAVSLERFLNFRKTSIYGGSNEIQKNIISKFVLGV